MSETASASSPSGVYFGVLAEDGSYAFGDYQKLGEYTAIDVSVSDEEIETYARVLAALPTCTTTFWLKTPWWSTNRLYKILGYRPPYTVRGLKRNGKSHKKTKAR